MRMSYAIITAASLVSIFTGCSNHANVSPSQNSSLHAVSPSITATSEGGMMQHSLDKWLKEEWNPMTAAPSLKTETKADGTVVTTKTEAATVTTTTKAPDGTVITKTETIPQGAEDTTPFTLQKYADKWKVYQENKAKMKEGQPLEPSHIDAVNALPVIGK